MPLDTALRVRLFDDGEQVADTPIEAQGELGEGHGSLYFGTYPPHSIGCDGAIAEVRISNSIRDIGPSGGKPFACDAHTIGLLGHRNEGDVTAGE